MPLVPALKLSTSRRLAPALVAYERAGWVSRGHPGSRHLATSAGAGYVTNVRVEVSSEAADFVRARGGRLWVWSATPRVCCWGSPAMMHVATEPPPGLTGFTPAGDAPVEIWFRAPGGRRPDVLEIGLAGRRRARVEAYWDGCRMAM